VNEIEAWWKAVVDAKYGCSWGGWCSIDPPGSYKVGFGSTLEGGGDYFRVITDLIWETIRGSDNVWCGKTSLKATFPALYSIASAKDAPLATNMDYSSGTLQWNIIFVHLIHDWEVDTLASFYSLLYSLRVRRGGEDKL
jgi:hypothetical protein